MCGIGLLATSKNYSSKNIRNRIEKIHNLQSSRGPDYKDETIFEVDKFRLSILHQRLKIIDQSESSNQPLESKDKRYILSFNGEIYNYRELAKDIKIRTNYSNGDTGVLMDMLIIHGNNALNYLRGMWSFIFIDTHKKEILISRDPFGIKPHFFFHNSNTLVCASSEVGVLALSGLEEKPNISLFRKCIENESLILGKETFFDKVLSLKPGITAKFKLNGNIIEKISEKFLEWSDQRSCNYKQESGDLIERSLLDSVSKHFRADTKVSIALSGGVDSSLLAYSAKKLNLDFDIFSIYNKGVSKNEYLTMQNTARDIDKIPKVVNIEPKSITLKEHEDCIRSLGIPINSFSHIAYSRLIKNVKANDCKCLISGQGADELFFGYTKYRFIALLDTFRNNGILHLFKHFIRLIIEGGLSDLFQFDEFSRINKRIKSLKINKKVKKSSRTLNLKNNSLLSRTQFQDINFYSVPPLVLYEDRISMSHGVEVRVPYLDKEIFKVAMSISPQEHIKGRRGKFHLINLIKFFSSKPEKYQIRKIGMNMDENVIIQKLIKDLGTFREWYIYKNEIVSMQYILDLVNNSFFMSNKQKILILNTEIWSRVFLFNKI